MANSARTGGKYYNNGSEVKQFLLGELVPEGWVLGKLNLGSNTGKVAYNDGKKIIFIAKGADVPNGFVKGDLKKKPKNQKAPTKTVRVTDGHIIRNIMAHKPMPEGFMDIHTYNKSLLCCFYPKPKMVAITDGVSETIIQHNFSIPDGWRIGKKHTQKRTKFMEMIDPASGEIVFVHQSESKLHPEYIRKIQRYKKGDSAPNKGRKKYVNSVGKVRYFKDSDVIPDGFFVPK